MAAHGLSAERFYEAVELTGKVAVRQRAFSARELQELAPANAAEAKVRRAETDPVLPFERFLSP